MPRKQKKTVSLQDFNAEFAAPVSSRDPRSELPSAPMGLPTEFEHGGGFNQPSRAGYGDDNSGRADASSSWRGSRGPASRGSGGPMGGGGGGFRGPPRERDEGGFSRGGGDAEGVDPDFGRGDSASTWRRADRIPARQVSRGNPMRGSAGGPPSRGGDGPDRSFGSSDARFAASSAAQSRYGDDGPPDFRSGGGNRSRPSPMMSSRGGGGGGGFDRAPAAAPEPEPATRFGANSQHPSDSGARRIRREVSGRFKDVVEEHRDAASAPVAERGTGLRDRSNIPKGSSRFADLGPAAPTGGAGLAGSSDPLPPKAEKTPFVASGRFARAELDKPTPVAAAAAGASADASTASSSASSEAAPRPVRSTPADPATASKNPFGAARKAERVALPPLTSTKRPTPSANSRLHQDARFPGSSKKPQQQQQQQQDDSSVSSPDGSQQQQQQQLIFKLRAAVADPLVSSVTADELAAGLSAEAPPVVWEDDGTDDEPVWDVAALLRTSVLRETLTLAEIDAVFSEAQSAAAQARGPAVLLATVKLLQAALGDAKLLALLDEQKVDLDWLRGRLLEASAADKKQELAAFLKTEGLVALVPVTANVAELVEAALQTAAGKGGDAAATRAAVLAALQQHVVSAELLDAAVVHAVAAHVYVAWADTQGGDAKKAALLQAWKPVVHAAAPPSHETAQVHLLLASHKALLAKWGKKFDKKAFKTLAQQLLDTGVVPAKSFVAWKHDLVLTKSDKAAKASKMKAILAIGTWVDELDTTFVDPEEEVPSEDDAEEEEVDPDDDELEQLGLGRPLNSEQ